MGKRSRRRETVQAQARPGRPGYDRSPRFLALIAAMWVVVGLFEIFFVQGWKYHFVGGAVFVGVGLLWARGAIVGYLRSRGEDVPASFKRK